MKPTLQLLTRAEHRDYHLFGCDCPTCEPYAPSTPRFRGSATATAIGLSAGITSGLVIVKLYDMLMPSLNVGLSAVFGS